MMQIAVMTTMIATARIMTAVFEAARSSQPKSSYVYRAPTSASEPTTRMPVVITAQPPSQPSHGPMERVTHENVVPASWSARFM